MRKVFLTMLVALLIGAAVVGLIEQDPGYILIAYANYTIESSLWIGLLLLILFVLVAYSLLRFLFKLAGGQFALPQLFGARRMRQAARFTNRGLIYFIEGQWRKARTFSKKGIKNSESPLLNHLVAARASFHLEEDDAARSYFKSAVDTDPEASVAARMVQAHTQIELGSLHQALITLEPVKSRASQTPRLLSLYLHIYQGLSDWDNLLGLLPELKRQQALSDDKLEALESVIYLNLLKTSVHRKEGEALENLRKQWQMLPNAYKRQQLFISHYAQLLLEHGDHPTAEKTLVSALKKNYDSNLVRLFGLMQTEKANNRLDLAERWISDHKDDPQLYLCLGRLASRAELWGKARDYYERSYHRQVTGEVCAELGRLLLAMGEERVGADYFREGLLLAQVKNLPAIPLPTPAITEQVLAEVEEAES